MDTFDPSSGAFFSITQITCVAVHAQVGQTGKVTQTVELETMRIREAYWTHVWVRVTWGGGGETDVLQCGLRERWDLSKAAALKCDQPPLTTAFSSAPRTRLLSKQSADSLINRGVHRGACHSIFSHLLTLISFAWTFMPWTFHHRSPSVH